MLFGRDRGSLPPMPLTPTATRALLDQLGHRPSRQLGQNFLVDGNIVRKSLALAEVASGDPIVEIGPGLGSLTEALLAAGAEVWAVELDPRLHAHLAATLVPAAGGRFHLLYGDAVEHPLAGLPQDGGEAASAGELSASDANRLQPSFKIVANLPYAISTPWLDAVLAGPLPVCLVLMVQREAADRLLASPGGKDFGAISVFLQSAFTPAHGHAVSRRCFFPIPEVDSRLLNLARRPEPFVFRRATKRAIRAVFQQRRKQIGPLLRRHAPLAAEPWLALLAADGFAPQSRPEENPSKLWQKLDAFFPRDLPLPSG